MEDLLARQNSVTNSNKTTTSFVEYEMLFHVFQNLQLAIHANPVTLVRSSTDCTHLKPILT